MDTLLHRLESWARDLPHADAQAWKQGTAWKKVSAIELKDRVEALARFLSAEGLGPGDVGLIYAFNSPGWVQMDLALMLVGASSAGIYTNASEKQSQYILRHSEAKLLVAENREALKKFFHDKPFREVAPQLKKIVVLAEEKNLPPEIIGMEAAVAAGMKKGGPSYGEFLTKLNPDQRATLIYTSGTTGQPKAVALSHRNLSFAAQSYRTTWDPPASGQLFSFLPLAHIAERIASTGIGLTNRYVVYFCSSPINIASEMREIQPTVLLCVPRLWDKLKEGAEGKITRLPERRQRLVRWAMRVSKEYQGLLLQNKFLSPVRRLKHAAADRIVLKKMREQLGLAQAQRTVSGAAALSPETMEWYRGIGVRLIEGYALSETSGVLTCGIGTTETAYTVGIPYPGVELRLASDGEIETRGPHLFLGYFKDDAATAEVLVDGWLKTGDLGTIDTRGYLKIRGRKREIIKNAEGKMISPLALEMLLLRSPLLDQAVVIGNERPHLVALLTLAEAVRPRRPEGLIVEDRGLLDPIQAHVDALNREVASHERIKAFRVLSRPFSIERDEMTATMKIKRRVIEVTFQDLIDSLYGTRREGREDGRLMEGKIQ